MADKFMYIFNDNIHKITHSVNYNSWLKRLDTQIIEPTNQDLIEVPKVDMPTNTKTLL